MPVVILSPDFTGQIRAVSQGAAAVSASAIGSFAADGAAAGASSMLATTFDPTYISSLKLWVAARLFADKTDGDAIATWTDKSGQGNDLTQSSGSLKPLFKQGAVGGRPALLFDGVDDFLTVPNFLSAFTAGEVFLVFKRTIETPPSSAKSGLWEFGTSSNATNFPFTNGIIYDDWGTNTRKTTVDPSPALASPNIYNVISASGEWTSNLNGTQIYTTASNTVGFTTTPSIGRSQVTGLDIFYDGYIAELLIFNAKLGTTDRDYVKNQLGGIYGITVA